jgi:putative amino-acid transport system substrate-binding protein
MKKWLVTGIVLFLITLGCSKPEPKSDAVMVGMSGTYYPFTFSKDDTLQGFEVDVWQEIAQRLGRPVEFVTTNFSGLFGMLEAGKIDTISNQITVTTERGAKYAFTTPYVYDGAQLVVRNDNDSVHGVEDLCGKRVAVNLGSNFEQILHRLDTAKCMEIVSYDSGIEQDVVIGRATAFMMDRNSAVALISESGLPLKLAGGPVEVLENAMPFRKDEGGLALRDEVSRVLDTMREDGTLSAISTQWFGVDITRIK